METEESKDIQKKLEDVHRDVDFANRYRLEYIKHLLTISSGIFIVSIAFMKDIIRDLDNLVCENYLFIGWFLLLISISAGIGHFKCWDRFYITYRPSVIKPTEKRKLINRLRIFFEFVQVMSFILALLLIFYFAWKNF